MPIDSTSKILALEQVAHALNHSDIKWAVCHGLDNYPAGIGRDLDIVVESSELYNAVHTTCQCLRNHGWTVLPNLQGWVWWVVAFQANPEGDIASLQIDFFDHLQWAFTWVIDGPGKDAPLIQRGPFWEDRTACLGKTLIINGLSKGYMAFKNKRHYLNITDDDYLLLIPLIKRISDLEPTAVTDLLMRGSQDDIDSAFKILRTSVRIKQIRSNGKWRRFKSAFIKQWATNINPKQGAPVILITGSNEPVWLDTANKLFSDLVYYGCYTWTKKCSGFKERHERKKSSCLQCVTIYSSFSIPSSIKPDLIIESCGQGGAIFKVTSNGDKFKINSPFDKRQITEAVMHLFKIQSISLQEKFSFY